MSDWQERFSQQCGDRPVTRLCKSSGLGVDWPRSNNDRKAPRLDDDPPVTMQPSQGCCFGLGANKVNGLVLLGETGTPDVHHSYTAGTP